jgi:hypothetical protein
MKERQRSEFHQRTNDQPKSKKLFFILQRLRSDDNKGIYFAKGKRFVSNGSRTYFNEHGWAQKGFLNEPEKNTRVPKGKHTKY